MKAYTMSKNFRVYYFFALVISLYFLTACKTSDPNKPIYSYNGKGPILGRHGIFGTRSQSGKESVSQDLRPHSEPGSIAVNGRDSIFVNAVSLLEGRLDHLSGVSNFREYSRDVINESWSSRAPFKTIVNRKIRDVDFKFSELKFCERGTYAELARIHNNARPAHRKAIQSGIAACMAAKESADYWPNSSKLLRQRYPDRREKGTGVVGVFQLDASPKEGNQSICMQQFSRWGIFNKVGCTGSACPARSVDQRYNVSCGTYFMISAWVSSATKNQKIGSCSYVIPDSDIQFGSRDKSSFVNCVRGLGNQQVIHSIADSMRYDNSLNIDRGMYVQDKDGEDQEKQFLRKHENGVSPAVGISRDRTT